MDLNLEHPRQAPAPAPLWPHCIPQVQHWGDSCGWTSCAVAITTLTGRPTTDSDLKPRYQGTALVDCLNKETGPKFHWHDTMNYGPITPNMWPLIEDRVRNGFPVIMGLNGEFSETGRGHVMDLIKVEGDQVTFCDSSVGPSGRFLVTTKEKVMNCGLYPGGNFCLICQKVGQ